MRTLLTTILLLLAAPAVAQTVPNAAPLAATVSVPAANTGTLPSPRGSTPCVVDWNADGSVNVLDVVAFITAWNAAGPGADFNTDGGINVLDVVAFITAWNDGCEPEPEIIVLRDSIGPDNTSTNFNGALPGAMIGGEWQVALIQVTAEVDVVLTEFRAIIVGISGTYDVDAFDYELRLWDSFASAQADPLCGQAACESFFFEVPTVGPTAFGTAVVDIHGVRPSYEVVFDLTGLGIELTAGQTRHLGFTVISPGGNAGTPGVVESEESGPATDRAGLFNYGWFFTSDIPFRSHDGRYGMSLKAETLP